QVALDGDVHRELGNFFVGVGIESKASRFEGMLPSPGNFLRIGCSGTSGLALAFAALPPLNKIAPLGERLPILPSMFVAGDGDELPTVSNFDLLENVDT